MEVLHPRCCGLDVHKETVAACLRLVVNGKVVKEVRTFATTTASLMALSEWLTQNKCTHVAMEATGVSGNPFGTSCPTMISSCCWRMPPISRTCRAARPT